MMNRIRMRMDLTFSMNAIQSTSYVAAEDKKQMKKKKSKRTCLGVYYLLFRFNLINLSPIIELK